MSGRLEVDDRADVLDGEGRCDGYTQAVGCDKARHVPENI
ncbi:hypothetical protein QF027_009600 [Streptomyces canus]|nr:hypothetical protein [Streptomyces canus]